MAGKGLVIGIDYTDRFCQACYYSSRHGRPESVSAGSDVRKYLIPSVLCYDPEISDWAIGDSAVRLSEKPGVKVFTELMRNVRAETTAMVEGREYTYIELMSIFYGKLIEFIQIMTSVMAVENITVTTRNVNKATRDSFAKIFGMLKIPKNKIKLLSSSECYSYFLLHEKEEMWRNGSLLFDFSSEGFYVEQLYVADHGFGPLVFVNEYDFSADFAYSNLASEVLRDQLDKKLTNLYNDLSADGGNRSVFFTGAGFNEPWFNNTLNCISDSKRAFKGSNIYVKGACIAGWMRAEHIEEKLPVICPGRTKYDISVRALDNGKYVDVLLSPGATDWYDADYEGDFILDNEQSVIINITSVVDGRQTQVEMKLDGFGTRPVKATRMQLSVRYRNESECIITATDKGFGDFFIDGGAEVTTTVNMNSIF